MITSEPSGENESRSPTEQRSPTPLQPVSLAKKAAPIVVVPQEEVAAGIRSAKLRIRVQQQQVDLDRWADTEIVRQLREVGFTGPLQQRLDNRLATYGMDVMRAWLHTGHAFTIAAKRGYGLNSTEQELTELASDPDLRRELAIAIIAGTIRSFRTIALVSGKWTPEGGASLSTFFMGASVPQIPNEISRWRRQRSGWQREREAWGQRPVDRSHQTVDPAAQVAGDQWRDSVLERAGARDPLNGKIVRLRDLGYGPTEIARVLGLANERVAEGRIARWQRSEQTILKGHK